MVRRRRDLTPADKLQLLHVLAAFRDKTLIPYCTEVPPASKGYRQASAVHNALLEWADTLAGKTDALIAPQHGTPPVKPKKPAED